MPSVRRLAFLASLALFCAAGAARADDAPSDGGVSDGGASDGGSSADAAPAPDAVSNDDVEIEKPRPKYKRPVEEAPAPAPAPQCKVDNDCALGSICEDTQCKLVQKTAKMVPPFWFHNGSHHAGYTIVAPFYVQWWKHDGEHDWDTKVAPLLLTWQHTNKHERATRLFPVVWHKTYFDADDGGKVVGHQVGVVPLFWWQSNKGHSYGAIPFLFTGWQHDPKRDFSELMVGLLGYYQREHDKVWRVGFPLYWDRQTQGSRFATFLPLVFFHRDGPATQTFALPLFFRFHNDQTHSDNTLFLPLFDYASLHNGRRSILISLLGAYERDLDQKRTQLLLLAPPFYHRRDPDLDLDVALPIFAKWKNRQSGGSGLIVGPYGKISDPSGSTTAFFPFYFGVKDTRTQAKTGFFLVGGYQKRPGFTVAAVGPGFGWRHDHDGKTTGWGGGLAPVLFFGHSGDKQHAAVLPLFWWSRDKAAGTQLTAVGPVYVRQDARVHAVDVGILPLFHFGHEDGRSYAYIAPIFWFRKTPERTTAVVGPVYASHGKNGDYDGGFAPLAFFRKHGEDRSQIVLPIFFRVAHGNDSTTVVLPFAHSHRGDTTIDALFPVAFVERKPNETTVGTLLGGYHRTGDRAVGVFANYIYRKDAHSSTHILFPIAFAHRSAQTDLTAVFPLVWDVRNGTQRDSLVVPLFWHRRGGYTNVDALLPLFVHARNPHSNTWAVGPGYVRTVDHGWTQAGLIGLFNYGQKREGDKVSRFVGGPGFFFSHNDFAGTQRLLVGPFFDTRRPDGYTSGLFPIAWAWRHGNSSYALGPFIYHHQDKATNFLLDVVGPLYWGKKDGDIRLGLAPIFFGSYGHGHSKTVLFPLMYFGKRTDGSTLVTPIGGYKSWKDGWMGVFGPLYVRHDKTTHTAWLFPLDYYTRNQTTGSSMLIAAPFYFDRQDKIDGTRLQAFTPVVWRWRSVERTVTVGLPLVFDSNVHGESRTTGVLPLFVTHRSEVTKSNWWTVPPLLMWSRTRPAEDGVTKTHDFVFFPLVWRFGGKEKSTTVGFPFFWDFKRGENRTLVVFPIMAKWSRPDGDRLVVLNTYYRKGKGPREGSWSLHVVPFFDVGHPRQHDFEWDLLEGLVGYSRLGRNRTLKLFWFIPIPLAPAPASSLTWWSNTPPNARVEF